MKVKITIADVAAIAGVSKTTVSRVLNGNYDHTTEETKERILQAVKELDYQPNGLAKSLKSMKTNIIGMVLSNLKNPFWASVLEGVEDTCRESGYNLMICNSNENPELEEQYIKEFQMRQVDGVVINITSRNDHLYRKLTDVGYPVVFINRKVSFPVPHSVLVDNIKGAQLGVNHLRDNGKKHIAAILFKNNYVSTWEERLIGYQQAMLENGFSSKDFLTLELNPQEGKVKEQTIHFLKKNPHIDGLVSMNNMLTLQVYEAIKEMKWSIPEDIALVGYDETVWAKHLNPPLTTIWQPGYEMGKVAAKNLINFIEQKQKTEGVTAVLDPKLIVRQSSGGK